MIAPATATASRQALAQQELARRKLARRHLLDFACYVDPDAANSYRAPHLQHVAAAFDRVVDGKTRRLMIFMPNRHWKSSLITRKGVAYFIGRRYEEERPHQVMIVSHTGDLAEEASGYTRNLVRDTDDMGRSLFRNVFPRIRISRTRQSEKEWGLLDLKGREEPFPTVTAGSMNAPPTGSGADLLVIDDPIKTPEQALSPTTQKNQWNTYQMGLHTRLNDEDESAVVLMMTRWSIEDLAGKLLRKAMEDPMAEQWEVVCLPALAYTPDEIESARRMGIPVPDEDPLGRQPGQALWPEKFSRSFHLQKQATSARSFASIGQQMPIQEGGQLLGRDAFKIISSPPPRVLRWVIASDWAIKSDEVAQKDKPDFNAFGLLGLWLPDKADRSSVRLVIGSLIRTRKGLSAAKILCRKFAIAMAHLVGKRPPIAAAADNIDSVALNDLRAHPELLNFAIHNLADRSMKHKLGSFTGDKVTKSAPWRTRAEGGMVYLVGEGWSIGALEGMFDDDAERRRLIGDEPLAWHEKFLTEIEGFPDWFNDDMVDMVSVGNHALGGDVSGTKKKARSMSG